MNRTFLTFFTILCLLSTVLLAGLSFNIQRVKAEINCDFFGVGEPLTYRSIGPTHENLNVSKAFEIMEDLGVCRLREWVWRWMVLNGSGTGLNQNIVEALNQIVVKANSLNITVMGMVQDFPSWMTGIEGDQQAVPYRNFTEGSNYTKFLDRYEESWETLAGAFPNITVWEIGNEYNLPKFLHPTGYNETDSRTWFDNKTQVDIVTDLLYYGSRGINASNPNAITVMCGLGPRENGIDDIRDFLKAIYENINSSRWPSTNPNDFFNVTCWHPYLFTEEPNWSNWVEPNIEVYNVMVNHGDGDKPVVFSEFGYSDLCCGLDETHVAEYLEAAFNLALDNLTPWLEAVYWFRLIDPDPCYDRDLPLSEYGFGLVKRPAENYDLKPAAHIYKKVIPEFPSTAMLILTIVSTTLAVIIGKKRLAKKHQLPNKPHARMLDLLI